MRKIETVDIVICTIIGFLMGFICAICVLK
jgi:hypothetical protein